MTTSSCNNSDSRLPKWPENEPRPPSEFKVLASKEFVFGLNGTVHRLQAEGVDADQTLLSYLRTSGVGLTSSKPGCLEGGCGACIVTLQDLSSQGKVRHRAVNACLYPLAAIDGKHVITAEGLANHSSGATLTGLHPVQERIAKMNGTQCGYCTPGFVMSGYTALAQAKDKAGDNENGEVSIGDIEDCFDGNLCRCTGYRPILDAMKTFAKSDDGKAVKICPSTGKVCDGSHNDGERQREAGMRSTTDGLELTAYDSERDIIRFPDDLRTSPRGRLLLTNTDCDVLWLRPTSVEEVLRLKALYPSAELIIGNTEVGMENNEKPRPLRSRPNGVLDVRIFLGDLYEMSGVTLNEDGLEILPSTTIEELRVALEKALDPHAPSHGPLYALLTQTQRFANPAVRSVASVAGNIVTASICGDLNPVLLASQAVLTLARWDSERSSVHMRKLPIREWFLGYHKVNKAPDEVLVNIFVPFTRPLEYIKAFKVSRRQMDDLSLVNGGFRVRLEEDHTASQNGFAAFKVAECTLAFGGMGRTTAEAVQTQTMLVGKPWTVETIESCIPTLHADLPVKKTRRSTAEYRRGLATSLLYKFYVHIMKILKTRGINVQLTTTEESALGPVLLNARHSAVHEYKEALDGEVGKPLPHASALAHAAGKAEFIDDTPPASNELYARYVLATGKAHAKLKGIDATAAIAYPGVVGILTAADFAKSGGLNMFGCIFVDEPILADGEILYNGQPVAVVVAESEQRAHEAAVLVKVEYGEDLPVVLTVEDAKKAGTYHSHEGHQYVTVSRGTEDIKKSVASCPHQIEGKIEVGAQYHFYIEPQGSRAIPGDDGDVTIHSAAQSSSKTQESVALALGLPQHRVSVISKRLGGSFGGKESRNVPIACCAALAARKFNRPVRMVLDRDHDMSLQGMRHPCTIEYCAGFTSDGRVQAVDVTMDFNGGISIDLSLSVMELALLHADNCYNIPAFQARGCVWATNRVSFSAFRGFGRPQSVQAIETIMERVASHTRMSPADVRAVNMYQEGDRHTTGMLMEQCNITSMYTRLRKSSHYDEEVSLCSSFNEEHRFKKRGCAIMPFKHGIAFTERFLNQAGCLLVIYLDGSVMLSIAGTEMGQGLYTKMAQVCASTLGIDVNLVRVVSTNTEKVPQMTPTAASSGADLNGPAVIDACKQIKARLQPISSKLPKNATWPELVKAAWLAKVSLSATGFYEGWKKVGYTIATADDRENPFPYFCFGCAMAVVEVDTLTGDYRIVRTDILQDVGNSLNPALDIGQIEGAFMQGVGYYTLEDAVWDGNGHLITRGPSTYKPPTLRDVPLSLRITLLPDAPNRSESNLLSSKAIGEPPFTLAYSVHLALRHAIASARADYFFAKGESLSTSSAHAGDVILDCPATNERIRMACLDAFIDNLPDEIPHVDIYHK